MTFKPTKWLPIAAVLSVLNVIGVAFATGAAHTTAHAVLAVGFAVWAQRLSHRIRKDHVADELPASDTQDRLDALEGEVSTMRRELEETQERLDFAERKLAQGPDARRVGPER